MFIAALAIVVSSCSTDEPSFEATDDGTTVDPTVEAVDLVDQFDQVLRVLNNRYEFSTTINSPGGTTRTIVGRNIDGNSVTTETTGGSSVTTIAVASQYWTRTSTGPWEAAAAAPSGLDPLAALFEVQQVSVLEGEMTLTYAGRGVGLDVDWVPAAVSVVGPAIEVSVEIDGTLVQLRVEPATDLTPITAPI